MSRPFYCLQSKVVEFIGQKQWFMPDLTLSRPRDLLHLK